MTLQAAPAAPDISIRARPPSPKRLSRKVLLAGVLAAGGIIAWALIAGLSDQTHRSATQAPAVGATTGPPETIAQASSAYDPATLQPPRDMLWGDHPPPANAAAEEQLQPPGDEAWAKAGPPSPAPASASAPASRGSLASRSPDPETIAHSAPIIFSKRGAAAKGDGAVDVGSPADGAHASFLASQRGPAAGRLEKILNPPRSPYEVLAGAVIPAALLTELNSDLPGRAIAQVTSAVFDSVTGQNLLIPQGARLIGTYDGATDPGDNRILLVWNRIVMPNGWSIDLNGMDATDPSGAAGLRDRTDNHLGPLANAIGLSAIISIIANNAEDRRGDRSLGQSVGEAAAQEAARTGGRIVDRQLQVKPTLRVRVGAPVRVLVTRDIGLKPYHEETR